MSSLGTTVGRPRVAETAVDETQHRRDLARASNRQLSGQLDTTITVTLAVNVATTVVMDSRCSRLTNAIFTPTTADAAVALASGAMFWACTNGILTIHHPNTATTDRVFTVSLLG